MVARVLTILATIALGAGALVWGAAAASADFDLGADLELGRPVHGTGVGPAAAGLAAAVLVVVAVVSWVDLRRAMRVLVWVAVAAVGLTGVGLVVRAVSGRFEVGDLQAIPFVVAFFAMPALVVAVILWLATVSGPPAASGPSGGQGRPPPGVDG